MSMNTGMDFNMFLTGKKTSNLIKQLTFVVILDYQILYFSKILQVHIEKLRLNTSYKKNFVFLRFIDICANVWR